MFKGIMKSEKAISSIEGVTVTPLKQFKDERGVVMHMIKKNSENFKDFGEIYFSFVNPNVVKGWKYHKSIFQNFAVPVGKIKLVIFDDRKLSKTKGHLHEIEFGADDYKLITLPPKIWYSFKGISVQPAMIANLIDQVHSPDECIVKELNDNSIPYQWD